MLIFNSILKIDNSVFSISSNYKTLSEISVAIHYANSMESIQEISKSYFAIFYHPHFKKVSRPPAALLLNSKRILANPLSPAMYLLNQRIQSLGNRPRNFRIPTFPSLVGTVNKEKKNRSIAKRRFFFSLLKQSNLSFALWQHRTSV